MNKLSIHINGKKYPIKSAEDPEYVEALAGEIDVGVRGLMSNGMSMNDAMVLLCLSYLDSWKKESLSCDNLRDQVTQYLEDASKARMELAEARREIERLQRQDNRNKGTR